jgi:hypothetical protein
MTREIDLHKIQEQDEYILEQEFDDVEEALEFFRNTDLLLGATQLTMIDDEGRGIVFDVSINYTAPYTVRVVVTKEG